jgi:RNA polymerase sigma-70 factor (ECF subfamily)
VGVEAVVSLRSKDPLNGTRPVMSALDDDDPNLVRRAATGDVEAFEALYRRSVGRVFALCLRMCGNRSLAEDLTQEAFVRAWQKLPSFRGDSAFATWMHRLTVNVVLGHLRSSGRRQDRESAAGELWGPAEAGRGDHPGDTVDLERAIATLPDRAREVFVLHDVEGYKHAEIADLAGMAVGTSKAQLNRARRLLRRALTS